MYISSWKRLLRVRQLAKQSGQASGQPLRMKHDKLQIMPHVEMQQAMTTLASTGEGHRTMSDNSLGWKSYLKVRGGSS